MEKLNATQAARQFSELLNRVRYQGKSFEITRGREVVARIVPAGPAARLKMADLARTLNALPRLGEQESTAFEDDLDAIRRELPPVTDPWA